MRANSAPIAVLSAATLMCALVGCASSNAATESSPPAAPVTESPSSSAPTDVAPVADAPALAVIDAAEAAALQESTATIAIRSSVDGKKSRGAGVVRLGDDPAARLTTTVAYQGREGEVTFVAVGGKAYLEVGELVGDERELWVELDESAARFAASLGPVAETFLTAADFTDLADLMRASEVNETGASMGDGPNGAVTTTLYSVDTSIDSAISIADPFLGEGLVALKSVGTTSIASEVGIVTKVEGEIGDYKAGLPDNYNVTLPGGRSILEYGAWGQPVSIQPPAATDVVSFAEAFQP